MTSVTPQDIYGTNGPQTVPGGDKLERHMPNGGQINAVKFTAPGGCQLSCAMSTLQWTSPLPLRTTAPLRGTPPNGPHTWLPQALPTPEMAAH
ncbi:hypothetical protein evm_008725 [Chilo suppressalis]|nr:hypothetical protein evm_008725 [Chilo suppressalis]